MTDGVDTYEFVYNGLGDRVQQTVNSVTITYVLDLNTGLTQVLSDGTESYLYGAGGIGEEGTTWDYHLGDSLGSVRQLTNGSGAVSLAQTYEPYGKVLSNLGDAVTSYGFTGEMRDPSGLIFLRARYLNPSVGRFVTRDTWGGIYRDPLSLNRWMYSSGNPVTYVDPSGMSPTVWSLLWMSSSNAVNISKLAYSKIGPLCLGLGGGYNSDPNTMGVEDLLVEFACEIGPKERIFGENAELTKELRRSLAVTNLRKSFLLSGKFTDIGTAWFDNYEFFEATLDALQERKLSIIHVLGTFEYEIVRQHGGLITFTIMNDTELSSGTRIPPILGGVHPSEEDSAFTIKELIRSQPILGFMPVISIIQLYPVISILDVKEREETSGLQGGGLITQTFQWHEQLSLACNPSVLWE
jgi:RHS repeat-associated protein